MSNTKDLFTDSNILNNPMVDSNRILYTASSFARSSLLHLQEIGELRALKPHTSSRSGLASYLFFTVISGTGTLVYKGSSFDLKPQSCVFINCSLPYLHETGGISGSSSGGTGESSEAGLWALKWIHFTGPTMQDIYNKYCERGGRPAFSLRESSHATDAFGLAIDSNMDKSEQVNAVWKSLFSTAGSDSYMRDMLINQELSMLLTLIMEQSWHPQEQNSLPPKRSLIVSVKEYLDQNYNLKITLDELSKAFYINKYYLAKTFKEQYGLSIHSYLLNVRITKAKQLLRFSDKKVEEIGQECGLGAAHYFSSKFKEVEGVSPSRFREQW